MCVPMDGGGGTSTVRDAGAAAQGLFVAVRRAGLGRVYGAVDHRVSVVSLPGGVTVWVRRGNYEWRIDGVLYRHPWEDAAGATQRIARELTA